MSAINYSTPPTPGALLREETLKRISRNEYLAWLKSDETNLENKIIEGDIYLTIDVLHKKIIEDCIFEGKIDTSVEDQYYVYFRNCIFKSGIKISVFKIGYEISFSFCTGKSITVENCESGGIWIQNCRLSENLNIRFCSSMKLIQVSNTEVNGDIILTELKISEYSAPVFERVNCNGTFRISSEVLIPMIYLTDGNYNKIDFSNGVQDLKIQGSTGDKIQINTLDFTSHTIPSTVYIQKARISNLIMNHLSGKQTSFEFVDIDIVETWEMSYSVPSDLRTFNLNVSECNIYFDCSLLTNCVFSNVAWPKKKLLKSSVYPKEARNNSLRESYRQLKQSMLKDGNNIDALAFYKNELEEYRCFAKENPEIKWEDKFILFTSWIFSDHGQSFVRPILWLIGIHLLLFLLLITTNFEGYHLTVQHDWSTTPKLMGEYLELLNPAHSFKDSTGWQGVIDFLMRLSSAFFIYHIIRASRKFAKL